VHCVPTDKTNASIRIQQILKVKIRIQRILKVKILLKVKIRIQRILKVKIRIRFVTSIVFMSGVSTLCIAGD